MVEMKEMSFRVFFILIAINAIFIWAIEDEQSPLNEYVGFEVNEEYSQTSLTTLLDDFRIEVQSSVEDLARVDLFAFLNSLLKVGVVVFNIFMTIAFGWTGLITAILSAVGLQSFQIIIITPLLILQFFGAFYLLRDLVSTIRGFGGG